MAILAPDAQRYKIKVMGVCKLLYAHMFLGVCVSIHTHQTNTHINMCVSVWMKVFRLVATQTLFMFWGFV